MSSKANNITTKPVTQALEKIDYPTTNTIKTIEDLIFNIRTEDQNWGAKNRIYIISQLTNIINSLQIEQKEDSINKKIPWLFSYQCDNLFQEKEYPNAVSQNIQYMRNKLVKIHKLAEKYNNSEILQEFNTWNDNHSGDEFFNKDKNIQQTNHKYGFQGGNIIESGILKKPDFDILNDDGTLCSQEQFEEAMRNAIEADENRTDEYAYDDPDYLSDDDPTKESPMKRKSAKNGK